MSPAAEPAFTGIPVAALDFYDDLEVDNTRSFWEKHKAVYDESVKAPMTALCAALEPEFGPAKVFRPYRDVRFAKDKTPYKTHQGAFVPAGPATGWYVQVSAQGVRTGAGFYEASSPRLAAIRAAIDDERRGTELERILATLAGAGWDVGGDRLKTSPRGYGADHPRIDLLRHRSLTVGRSHGFEPFIHTPELLDVVRDDWRALRPLVEWVAENAEPRAGA
ncbi:DUF2461 domain-containing protein [Nocardioides sp. MAHUQ-72]|uniref:DUF2461 domain-containing protein n=1 Tax=unclassified Nocardioides TaxID=2615069 RepID=UPI0036063390